MWKDDDEELSKKVEELEEQMLEILDRMKQYEAVLTSAFLLRDAGNWRAEIPKDKEITEIPKD